MYSLLNIISADKSEMTRAGNLVHTEMSENLKGRDLGIDGRIIILKLILKK
jgi:hypothetical protein